MKFFIFYSIFQQRFLFIFLTISTEKNQNRGNVNIIPDKTRIFIQNVYFKIQKF
jgi:hypothetical protein